MRFRPTKRPENRCDDCGHRWSPKGHYVSSECPDCKSSKVSVPESPLLPCLVLLGLVVIGFLIFRENPIEPIKTKEPEKASQPPDETVDVPEEDKEEVEKPPVKREYDDPYEDPVKVASIARLEERFPSIMAGCIACVGKLRIVCSVCDEGRITMPLSGETRRCPSCDGDGEQRCYLCSGTGKPQPRYVTNTLVHARDLHEEIARSGVPPSTVHLDTYVGVLGILDEVTRGKDGTYAVLAAGGGSRFRCQLSSIHFGQSRHLADGEPILVIGQVQRLNDREIILKWALVPPVDPE